MLHERLVAELAEERDGPGVPVDGTGVRGRACRRICGRQRASGDVEVAHEHEGLEEVLEIRRRDVVRQGQGLARGRRRLGTI